MVKLIIAVFLGAIAMVTLMEPMVETAPMSNSANISQLEDFRGVEKFSNFASCSPQYRFNNGQCTDWADARYYQLTCRHTEWWGDARLWASRAQNTNGWVVSNQPRVPSIIVIQPGYQGCGPPGHVAVVERINGDGSVYTSNWNYKFNGQGGVYSTSYGNFYSGAGVQYIWHQ